MPVRILCIGDVVGKPGRGMLADHLKFLIDARKIDLVVCNAENAAGGSGLTPQIYHKLINYGVDVITLGDHVYRRLEIADVLKGSDRIVRPMNLSAKAVGRRWTVVPTKSGEHQVAVGCVLGQLFMGSNNSPWQALDDVQAEIPPEVRIRVFDVHAEASSEKIALGWYLNGKASVVFGTHTHIPTADARVLDGGTAFISDVGMTGPYDSVLGRRKERVIAAFSTNMPFPFEVAEGDPRLCGVLADVDPATGRALAVERVEVCGRAESQARDDEADDDSSARKRPAARAAETAD